MLFRSGISPEVPNEELKVIEETKLQSSDETSGSAEAAKEIEETTLPTLEEEGRVPEVVPRGIEETKLLASDVSVAEVSKENVNNSLQPLANAPVVDTSYVGEEGNKTEIPESTGNPVSNFKTRSNGFQISLLIFVRPFHFF